MTRLPEPKDVKAAAARIRGIATVTPLLEYSDLNARLDARILIKPEMLQRTGSFKFRGACNRIARLDPDERRRGIVAFSSGNHAQAVAASAAAVGTSATIVMPEDAPAIKVARTRAYGGDVVFYDRYTEDRAAIAASIVRERGATLVPPYDDPDIIAGQGTIGLELIDQAEAVGARLDAAVIPCSGGGLSSGCALALHGGDPSIDVHVAEPVGYDDTLRSLEEGRPVAIRDVTARSICDALLVHQPGDMTFAINREHLAGAQTVSDGSVAEAMRVAFRDLKLVIEPGGAAALAAVLSGAIDVAGKTVAVVCSGGNVDTDLFGRILGGGEA